MSKPHIHYFPIRGRVEPIRLTFEFASVDYQVTPVFGDAWAQLKPSLAFGQLPLYKDDQIELVQSLAILRHVGRRWNLYGQTEAESAHIDVVLDSFSDLGNALFKGIFDPSFNEKKEEFKGILEGWLVNLENYLKRNQNGQSFFVGPDFSIADAFAFHILDNFVKPLAPKVLESHEILSNYRKRIAELPQIAAYLASDRRPAITLPPGMSPLLSTPEECQ